MFVEDDEMPDRTLNQVVSELQQVRAKITSLDGQLSSQKQKAKELADELSGMASEMLPSGYTMEIRARDGLQVATRKARSDAGKPRGTKANDGASETDVRNWLKQNGHSPNRGRLSENYWNIYNNAH